MCIALGLNAFSFPRWLIPASIMHREKNQSFVQASDLIYSLLLSSASPTRLTWVSLCTSQLACSMKPGQLYCPNWTEGSWLVLDGECLDWPFCSRKVLRQHLSPWDSLLIRKWCKLWWYKWYKCHCVCVWASGGRRTAWSHRKGRPLNFMVLSGWLGGNVGEYR